MSYPFLWPACAWTAGIWVCSQTGLASGPAMGMAGVCLAAAWLSFFVSSSRAVLVYLLLAAFFLGAGSLAVQERHYETNAVHGLKAEGYMDFFGRLYKSPSRGIDRDYLFLRLEKMENGSGIQALRGNIRVSVPHSRLFPKKRTLRTGDRVRLTAGIVVPAEYRNFTPPRSTPYLQTQNLHALAFSKSPLLVEKTERAVPLSIRRIASSLRQAFQDRVEERFGDAQSGGLSQAGAVLEALLLGERRRMDDTVTLAFQESGLLHLIAISGAHIGIICVLLLGFFRIVGLASRPSALLLILSLVFYTVLVEGSPSVLRSTIIAVSFLAGRLIWRESHILNSLAYSAFFLLFLNPFSLFDPGFQLTYAATLSIVLFQPRIVQRLPRLPLKTSQALALSLAAQVGVIPIIAAAFNRVALASIVLNLAAVPLVAAIMAAGYVYFPAAYIAPGAAGLLSGALKLMISLLLCLSRLSGASPLLSFRVPNPSLVTILGYYIFLLGLLLPVKRRGQKAVWLSGLALVTALIVFHPWCASVGNLRITVLDVGQGDSILLEFPGRAKMLIDGGGMPTGSFDPGEKVVSPALWRKGINTLDIIVSTHPHPDHIKGLAAVARNFKPRELWEAPAADDDVLRQKLRASLPDGTVPRVVTRGFKRRIAGVLLEVLHPGPEAPLSGAAANDQSLVLRVSYGRTAFILAADIGRAAEDQIIGSGLPLRGGVLKAGHHGSDSSSSPEFLNRVSPRLAIISIGRGNAFGLPREETLKRFRAAGAVVFRTDNEGAVEVTSDGRSYAVRTAARPDLFRIFR